MQPLVEVSTAVIYHGISQTAADGKVNPSLSRSGTRISFKLIAPRILDIPRIYIYIYICIYIYIYIHLSLHQGTLSSLANVIDTATTQILNLICVLLTFSALYKRNPTIISFEPDNPSILSLCVKSNAVLLMHRASARPDKILGSKT